jgi:hypothetical protein
VGSVLLISRVVTLAAAAASSTQYLCACTPRANEPPHVRVLAARTAHHAAGASTCATFGRTQPCRRRSTCRSAPSPPRSGRTTSSASCLMRAGRATTSRCALCRRRQHCTPALCATVALAAHAAVVRSRPLCCSPTHAHTHTQTRAQCVAATHTNRRWRLLRAWRRATPPCKRLVVGSGSC